MKNAPIILLDEASASLDVESETYVQMALSRLIENKTVIMIAHRMRTVANASHLVVLENGQEAFFVFYFSCFLLKNPCFFCSKAYNERKTGTTSVLHRRSQ